MDGMMQLTNVMNNPHIRNWGTSVLVESSISILVSKITNRYASKELVKSSIWTLTRQAIITNTCLKAIQCYVQYQQSIALSALDASDEDSWHGFSALRKAGIHPYVCCSFLVGLPLIILLGSYYRSRSSSEPHTENK